MLEINIKDLLTQKGIKEPYGWLRRQHVSHGMAHKLLNGKYHFIPLKVFAVICEQAYCTPNDLFKWVPNDTIQDDDSHPLFALKRTEPKIRIDRKLEKMDLEKLRKLEQMIDQMEKEEEEKEE